MTRKCHKIYTLQPNPRHHEEKHRAIKTRNSASKKTINVKQLAILLRPDDSKSETPLSNA